MLCLRIANSVSRTDVLRGANPRAPPGIATQIPRDPSIIVLLLPTNEKFLLNDEFDSPIRRRSCTIQDMTVEVMWAAGRVEKNLVRANIFRTSQKATHRKRRIGTPFIPNPTLCEPLLSRIGLSAPCPVYPVSDLIADIPGRQLCAITGSWHLFAFVARSVKSNIIPRAASTARHDGCRFAPLL